MSACASRLQSRTAPAPAPSARPSDRRKLDRGVVAGALFGLLKGQEAPVTKCNLYSGLWARLKQQGLPDQLASLQSIGKKGRGLVAEQKIKKGEELLQIPFECALTSASALEGSPLLQRLNADEALDDWTILAVFLAQNRYYKRMTAGGTQDAGSLAQSSGLKREAAEAWAPYIYALPSRTGAVLEWTQVELDSVRTTSAAVAAAQVTSSAAAAWQQVEPMVQDAVPAMDMSPFAVTEETFRWGVSILLSRLIRLQDGPLMEALVPWADFINHSTASGAYVRVSTGVTGQIDALTNRFTGFGDSLGGMLGQGGNDDPDVAARKRRDRREKAVASLQGTFIALRADRDFPKAQEVVASYGQKSSGDLLVSYGFVPPPGTNPHDTYILTLRVSAEDANATQKEELLEQYGFRAQQSFPIKWSGWPSALLPFAAFVFSRPEDASDLPELARILLKEGQFPGLDGMDTYELAQESVSDALEVVYDKLDSSADVKRAETVAMPSTIVPAAAVPVSEDGEEVEVTDLEATTYVLGALAAVRQREKQIIGRTMRLLFEQEPT